MGFGVWGLGFGVWGLGFGVWGLGSIGNPGIGGEYICQEGFGWTNGVLLCFLKDFGGLISQREYLSYVASKDYEILY